ncbi:uncharacterized protein [Nicotiana tomentosiformis]|uniref:uncharacterized protein n=1 Tax=Nicotiana tomentosiformis TaxID=4098 RepID=UPI00388C979E
MRILESHGVDFTTFKWEGRARRWWESYILGRPASSPPMTWDQFTRLFLDRYITPSDKEELRFLFKQPQQGQMSVTDYEARFSELSCHALMILPTDVERGWRFVVGLHSASQATMAREVEIGTSFELVIEIARRIEGAHQRCREQARRAKRFQYSGEFSGAPAGGKGHQGQTSCQQSSILRGYYECGDPGHMKRSIGPALLQSSCYETQEDLPLLDMTDFEVIPGMDWLSPYHSILDFHAKTVTLAMPELPRLEWRGSSVSTSSWVISFLKAQHMVEKGCLSYLAYVRDTTVETPVNDSVHMVREFADVFLSNLPGMPPDRDIDFCIDLASGSQPISIPP